MNGNRTKGQKSVIEGQNIRAIFGCAIICMLAVKRVKFITARKQRDKAGGKNMKESFLYRTIISCKFALMIGWKISRKRVIMEFLHWFVLHIDWLIISCVLVRFILDMAMKRTSFGKMMVYIWSVVALEALVEIFSRLLRRMSSLLRMWNCIQKSTGCCMTRHVR